MILMNCLDLMICIEEIEMEESQVEKGERVDREERKYNLRSERKKYLTNKIQSYSDRVYMHGYCSKCTNMHTFRSTDVEHFLGKMCKMCLFILCKGLHPLMRIL